MAVSTGLTVGVSVRLLHLVTGDQIGLMWSASQFPFTEMS